MNAGNDPLVPIVMLFMLFIIILIMASCTTRPQYDCGASGAGTTSKCHLKVEP